MLGLQSGSYEPEGEAVSIIAARNEFLSVVARRKPDVLKDLAGNPFEAFLKMYPQEWCYYPHVFSYIFARRGEAFIPTAMALREALWDWADRYHLQDWWCIELALWTLFHWRKDSKLREQFEWKYVFPPRYGLLSSHDEKELSEEFWSSKDGTVFGFPHWDPDDGHQWNRSLYEEILTKNFKTRMHAYLDKIESMARERGLKRVSKIEKDHFMWLVAYQIEERLQEEIRKDARRGSEQTVSKAIGKLANYIGLTLRYCGRGKRPKKASRSELSTSDLILKAAESRRRQRLIDLKE
jgi:hypothetical protein